MKKLFVLAIALLVICAPVFAENVLVNGDFSNGEEGWTRWNSSWGGGFTWDASAGYGSLSTSGGSFGWYQVINVVAGAQYTINANWMGNGSSNWCEVLFFNPNQYTGGDWTMLEQLDGKSPNPPPNQSIISKVDGWGLNGGMPFKNVGGTAGFGSITDFYLPAGLKTNVITATGSTMVVGLKTGASNGSTICLFDDVTVDGPAVPEPASMLALVAGLGGLIIRRKR